MAKLLRRGGSEYCNSICRATDGSIWLGGSNIYAIRDSFEFDIFYGRQDAWFVHADSIGNFLNGKVLGSSQDDDGILIYPLSDNTVIAGGGYGGNNGTFSSLGLYGVYPNIWDAFLTVFAPWTTGISEVNPHNIVGLFPNPAGTTLTIKMKESIRKLTINDVVGREVYTNTITDNTAELNILVSDWQKGLYYVTVINDKGYKATKTLIIQ